MNIWDISRTHSCSVKYFNSKRPRKEKNFHSIIDRTNRTSENRIDSQYCINFSSNIIRVSTQHTSDQNRTETHGLCCSCMRDDFLLQ